MEAEIFRDTASAMALSSPNDQCHPRAIELADQLESFGTRLVTTRAVLVEIANALSRQRSRQAAVHVLDSLEADPKMDIVPMSEPRSVRALRLYRERPDKDWRLTDGVSFLVRQDRSLTDALTTDEHVQQAGFRV